MPAKIRVPRCREQPPKLALVLVDMLQADTRMLSYRHGSPAEGMQRVIGLIERARQEGILVIPTVFKIDAKDPMLFGGIWEVCQRMGIAPMVKYLSSTFSSQAFEQRLDSEGITHLWIAGHNRTMCPLRTAREGAEKGYVPITSDEVLFGTAFSDNHGRMTRAMETYAFVGHVFDTVERMVEVSLVYTQDPARHPELETSGFWTGRACP